MPSYDLTSGYIEDPQTGERLGRYLYAILPGVMLQGVTEDGEVYGSSWSGKAMIDTGANTSAVYSPLIQELHLLPGGSLIDVTGSQSQGDAAECQTKPAPLYLARITVLGRGADLRMVDRGDFDPVLAELFKVIIGTDILQDYRFTYNDPPGKFSLEYQPALTGAVTASMSSLLRELAHVRQARLGCLRRCPPIAVRTLGRRSHRVRGRDLLIRRFPYGYPHSFRSVRHFGGVSGRLFVEVRRTGESFIRVAPGRAPRALGSCLDPSPEPDCCREPSHGAFGEDTGTSARMTVVGNPHFSALTVSLGSEPAVARTVADDRDRPAGTAHPARLMAGAAAARRNASPATRRPCIARRRAKRTGTRNWSRRTGRSPDAGDRSRSS